MALNSIITFLDILIIIFHIFFAIFSNIFDSLEIDNVLYWSQQLDCVFNITQITLSMMSNVHMHLDVCKWKMFSVTGKIWIVTEAYCGVRSSFLVMYIFLSRSLPERTPAPATPRTIFTPAPLKNALMPSLAISSCTLEWVGCHKKYIW